jgi:hypothetical protein
MGAITTDVIVKSNVLIPFVMASFGLVVFAMMKFVMKKKWIPKKITNSTGELLNMSNACVVLKHRLYRTSVNSVRRNLQNISVAFANFTTTKVRKKASTIAKNAAFVELEAKIIFSIATAAAAA